MDAKSLPLLTRLVCQEMGVAELHLAYGDNGYWYVNVEDLERVAEGVCAERFQPVKRFGGFVTYNDQGREARQTWNDRMGPHKGHHVHFTTEQAGFAGTWTIYDLGQGYAAWVDPWFNMRVTEVYRQATTGIYHQDEHNRPPLPTALEGTVYTRALAAALVELADKHDAITADVQEIRVDLSDVKGRVSHLELRQPPDGWLTVTLYLQSERIQFPGKKEYTVLCQFVRKAMGTQQAFLFLRPGKNWPDEYFPPDVLAQGWEQYQQHFPRLL